jgi:hypothetical protein
MADVEAEEYNAVLIGLWTRGSLIRRSIADRIWRSSRLGAWLARRCDERIKR